MGVGEAGEHFVFGDGSIVFVAVASSHVVSIVGFWITGVEEQLRFSRCCGINDAISFQDDLWEFLEKLRIFLH